MPAIAWAQGAPPAANRTCPVALPAPDCRFFFIANLGAYIGTADGGTMLPVVSVDWGGMVNVSPRNALGAAWFATWDEYGLNTGPVARYRLWLARGRSLDLAVGTPVAGNGGSWYAVLKSGSIVGLVKYNPVHWFGFALRPDYLRRNTWVCNYSCTFTASVFARFSVGVELTF